MHRILHPFFAFLCFSVIVLGQAGCGSSNGGEVVKPGRLLFIEAESLENDGIYAEALTKYQKIADQNPGTVLATFSYLKIAEIKYAQLEWPEAETNYRLFLGLNPSTHLTPYVIFRLLKVNHEKSNSGIFFPEREVDRDAGPYRQIILEYKRFFLLYPKSPYLPEIVPLFRDARAALAGYERVVGDYYFNRGEFHSAIGRYIYLLKNYPEFAEGKAVLSKLISAYRKNGQPEQAKEMEVIFARLFTGTEAKSGGSGLAATLPGNP